MKVSLELPTGKFVTMSECGQGVNRLVIQFERLEDMQQAHTQLMEQVAGRGTGRTAQLMKDAPPKALFIWCNEQLAYPRGLAIQLKRPDLLIVPPSILDDPDNFRGRTYSRVVLDHATKLSPHQQLNWGQAISNARPPREAGP